MNSERYEKLLENHLLPSTLMHRSEYFLQDRTPYHASKKIKTFLETNNIKTVGWPGNSPDLNPLENYWTHIKNMLVKKDIGSVPKLTEAILEVWVNDLTLNTSKSSRIQCRTG
jgi:transposase